MSHLASARSTALAHDTERPASTASLSVPTPLPQYLVQRNAVFYFKRKIPAALAGAFENRSQVWKSLNTTDFNEACRQLRREMAAFELQLASARHRAVMEGLIASPTNNLTIDLSVDMIPALLQRYEAHMLQADDDEWREMRPLQAADIAQRQAEINEAFKFLSNAQLTDDSAAVDETVSQLLAGEGIRAKRGSPARAQLCRELLATEMRILREQRARLEGNRQPTPAAPVAVRLQPTLNDYLDTWLRVKPRPARTVNMTESTVKRWNAVMGEVPAAGIKRSDVKLFRDRLMAQQLSSATIRNRLGLLRAVVACYHDEHDIEGVVNPFGDITVENLGQRVRQEKVRRAFEMSELNHLYRSSVFTAKRLPGGQCGPAAYWLPLMGPFVGARIEELAQLNLADIEVINVIWTLRICKFDRKNQSLKTKSSFRRVPIRAELIRLGFLRYLCEQRRNGETRVFSTLTANNKNETWSNAVGKWFGRFLDKRGLSSPDVDYHSFRYTFKQQLTYCGANIEVRDALTGHWGDDSAGKVYLRRADGLYDFRLLCEAMNHLRYGELDLSHLYVDDPYMDVDARLFVG